MDLSSIVTDNITEVLVKVIEFAGRRHKILTRNILDANTADFLPMDLDVAEFSDVMMTGIAEHIRSKRLLLCDSENIKFGVGGDFVSIEIVDQEAKHLLEGNMAGYLELQIEKLTENLLNKKVAVQLLEQKHGQSWPTECLNDEPRMEDKRQGL